MKLSLSPTIIFTHGGGRFANQLLAYSQLLAFAIEHESRHVDFVNMSFWEYAGLLEKTSQQPWCTWSQDPNQHRFFKLLNFLTGKVGIKNNSSLKRLLIFILYLYGGNTLARHYSTQAITAEANDFLLGKKVRGTDLSVEPELRQILGTKLTFLSGWEVFNWQLVEKHQQRIRSHLAIHPKYQAIGAEFIAAQRSQYDFLIGVMIRQGDYRTWLNGRFFFEVEQYVAWMAQAAAIFADKGRIGFVVASDEAQTPERFPGLSVQFTTGIAGATGHYIESMVELSLCDLIITTASTFSMWAAFIREVPILPIYNSAQVMSQKDLLDNHLFGMLKNTRFQ